MEIEVRSQKPEFRIQKRDDRKPAKTFEELIVGQKSHALVLEIYRRSSGFPKNEVYGLTSQMRRAVISIPANIAEGFKKRGKLDKARYMNTAQGSLEETRYYLILSRDLGYLSDHNLFNRLEEVGRLLESSTRNILTSDS